MDEIVERIDAASIHPDGLSYLGDSAVKLEVPSGFPEAQQIIVDGKPRMICRICDFEIPMVCAEGHFIVCTLADRCDSKGLNTDQRLQRVAEVLGRVLGCFESKSPQTAECNHNETARGSTSSLTESDGSMDHDILSHLLTVPSTELFSEVVASSSSNNSILRRNNYNCSVLIIWIVDILLVKLAGSTHTSVRQHATVTIADTKN